MVHSRAMVQRLFLAAVFLAVAALTGWYALVHTVHLGTRSIPDLRGLTVDEARQVAHDTGLALRVDEPGVFSGDVAVGAVAQQAPHPGFHVKSGSTVRVQISLGARQVTVPDLRGGSLQAALRVFEQVGLQPGHRSEVQAEAPGEAVLATTPAMEAGVAPESAVDLLVNATPAQPIWVMPDLLSRQLDSVERFLRASGLRLAQIHRVAYPGIAPGTVLRQYPAAGSPVSRSDVITLWASR